MRYDVNAVTIFDHFYLVERIDGKFMYMNAHMTEFGGTENHRSE